LLLRNPTKIEGIKWFQGGLTARKPDAAKYIDRLTDTVGFRNRDRADIDAGSNESNFVAEFSWIQ
jgi:hypothetical protein